jgi:hypothetical protein
VCRDNIYGVLKVRSMFYLEISFKRWLVYLEKATDKSSVAARVCPF